VLILVFGEKSPIFSGGGEESMEQQHMIARILRALSGKTQEQVAEELGVDASLIAQFERGKALPSQEHLDGLARSAKLTVPDAEMILRLFDMLREPPLRRSEHLDEAVERLQELAGVVIKAAYVQLLGVPIPGGPPKPEEHKRAKELFQELEGLSQEERLVVVQSIEEYQTWVLLERVCLAVDREAPRNEEKALEWIEVAREIAAHIEGSEEWRKCVKAYAAQHAAKVPKSLPS
jgi:transcriptional regulator with XRE-family HTH domain